MARCRLVLPSGGINNRAPRLPQVLADIMNDSEGGDSGGVAVWAAEALLPQVVYSGPHLQGSTISVAWPGPCGRCGRQAHQESSSRQI